MELNIEGLRAYCLSKRGVTECFPFDESTLVFKAGGKMFALTSLDENLWINLKCDPEKAITLREEYEAVTAGYHMNKKHWNTVRIDGSVPAALICEWIDHSYRLVVDSLTKKQQQLLANEGLNKQ